MFYKKEVGIQEGLFRGNDIGGGEKGIGTKVDDLMCKVVEDRRLFVNVERMWMDTLTKRYILERIQIDFRRVGYHPRNNISLSKKSFTLPTELVTSGDSGVPDVTYSNRG